MPRISEFYGIVIEMYFADHAPPHFQARYRGEEATIVIATGELLAGAIPAAPCAWCENGSMCTVRKSRPIGTAPAGMSSPPASPRFYD